MQLNISDVRQRFLTLIDAIEASRHGRRVTFHSSGKRATQARSHQQPKILVTSFFRDVNTWLALSPVALLSTNACYLPCRLKRSSIKR